MSRTGRKVVEVTWVDSAHAGGWRDNDEQASFHRSAQGSISTVGYLLQRDKAGILLCASETNTGRAQLTFIPRVAILTYKVVKRSKAS